MLHSRFRRVGIAIALTAFSNGAVSLGGSLISIAPAGASPNVTIAITGTGFDVIASNNHVTFIPPASAPVVRAGVSIAPLNAGLQRLSVPVPPGLPASTVAVRVTNTTTGEVSEGKTVDIVEIRLPSVNSGRRGTDHLKVPIAGSANALFVAGAVRAAFGPGITVHSTQVVSQTSVVADISIAPTAAPGSRNVGVITTTQTTLLASGFTVAAGNQPPVFTSTPNTSATQNATYSYLAEAKDPDRDVLTFQLIQGPSGLNVSTTGLVSWTPVTIGRQHVVLRVADPTGASADQEFNIVVAPPATLQSLSVSPVAVRFTDLTATRQLLVIGHYSDGGTRDLTATADTTYTSANRFVARANAAGEVSPVANGATAITVRYAELTAPVAVTVETGVTLESLELTPSTVTLRGSGSQAQLTVRAHYSDGTTRNVTDATTGTTYTLIDPGVAHVSPNGLVTAENSGTRIVVAAHEGLTARSQVVVIATTGSGFVRGRVYDDTRGLPLRGAKIAVLEDGQEVHTNPVTAVADALGDFSVRARAGPVLIRVEKEGFTTVERRAEIPQSGVIRILDARLTPTDLQANSIPSAFGGEARNASRRFRLVVPAGALEEDASVVLTPVSNQGLQARLPAGWSPVAAVDVRPEGLQFGQPATLWVSPVLSDSKNTSVTVATYDPVRHEWMVTGTASRSMPETDILTPVAKTGQYVFLVPDEMPGPPPPAEAGSPLPGVTEIPLTADTAGSSHVVPRSAPPSEDVRATGTVVLHTGGKSPSGTVFEAHVSEAFDLVEGSRVVPQPFSQHLVAYAHPRLGAPGTLATDFQITPSRAFSLQQLSLGKVKIDVTPAVFSAGSIIDSSGETTAGPNGAVLVIPAGALPEETVVQLRTVPTDRLPISIPSGFEVLGNIVVDLTGATLQQSGTLSIPGRANLPDSSSVIVAQVVADPADVPRLRIAAAAEVQAGRVTTRSMATTTLPGVRSGGLYIFLRSEQALAFVRGTITAGSGEPQNASVVTTDRAPFADITGPDGTYVVAVPAGAPARVTASRSGAQNATSSTVTIGPPNTVAQVDLTLGVLVTSVIAVSPASGASQVPLNVPIVVRFSQEMDSRTLQAENVFLRAGDIRVPGQIVPSADRRALAFRPTNELASNTEYSLVLLPAIRDMSGNNLTPIAPVTFRTVDASKPPQPAPGQIVAALPDSSGVVLVTGSLGTAAPSTGVTVTNVRTQETATVLALTDGSFRTRVPAAIGDELALTLRDTSDREQTIAISQLEGPDGTTGLGDRGGTVAGPSSIAGTVLPRALAGPATLRIASAPTETVALPAGFQSIASFEVLFEGGPFRALRSLTLSESQNRFTPVIAAAQPFAAAASMTVPSDFLVNGSLKSSAVAEDTDGNQNSVAGTVSIVDTKPGGNRVETSFSSHFPTVYLETPDQAMRNQQVHVAASAPAARLDIELPAPEPAAGTASFLLAKASRVGGQLRLAIVDSFVVAQIAGRRMLRTAGRNFPGISTAGRFYVISSAEPLVLMTGQITGPEAHVLLDGSPFLFEAGSNSSFALPVVAGRRFTVQFVDAATGNVRGTYSGQAPDGGTIDIGSPLSAPGRTLRVTARPDANSIVDIDEPVKFFFSEAIDPAALAESITITDDGGLRVFGHVAVSGDGLEASFMPRLRWKYGTRYRYVLSPAAVALSGVRLAQAYTGEFTTFAPRVLSTVAAGAVRDVDITGNLAVVGAGTGLSVIDVTHPNRPAVVGQVAIAGGVAGVRLLSGVSLKGRDGQPISGSLAVVVGGGGSSPGVLRVIDLNRPASPAIIGSAQLTTPAGESPPEGVPNAAGVPSAVAVSADGKAVAAVQNVGVQSIDLGQAIPTPSRPGAPLGPRYPASGFENANDVAVLGSSILAVGTNGLTVLSGSTFQKLSSMSTTGNAQGVDGLTAFQMDVNADGRIDGASETIDLAVVANGGDGTVQLFDVSSRDRPKLLSIVRLPGEAASVVLDRNERLAYVGTSTRGIQIVDLAAAASLNPVDLDGDGVDDRLLGSVATGGNCGRIALDLGRGVAYVANGAGGMAVVQVLPPRTAFQTLRRDPVRSDTGDEQSIAEARVAFTTDEALLVTVNTIPPPDTALFLTIDEVPDAGGTKSLTFADGANSAALQNGLNNIAVMIRSNASPGRATLSVREADGRVVRAFDFRLAGVDTGGLVLESLRVTPQDAIVSVERDALQISVSGEFNGGKVYNLTASPLVTYAVTNPATAAIGNAGLLKAVGGGTTSVIVSSGKVSAATRVRVDHPPALSAIEVTEPLITLTAAGQKYALSVSGHFSSGSVENISRNAGTRYISANPAIVSVDASGVLTAGSDGTTVITIANGFVQTQARVSVESGSPARVTGIRLTPFPTAVAADARLAEARATVVGSGSLDGLNVTFTVAPGSMRPIAAKSGYSGVAGALLRGLAPGTWTVTATVTDPTSKATFSDNAALTVHAGTGDNEPNDAVATASPLAPDKRISGSLGAGADPRDVFRVDSSTAGTLDIEVRVDDQITQSQASIVFLAADGAELGRTQLRSGLNTVSRTTSSGPALFAIEAVGAAFTYAVEALIRQAPVTITSVSPAAGPAGTTMTIDGTGFSLVADDNIVLFGGVAGQVRSADGARLQVVVPAAAVDGPIQVIVRARSATGPRFVAGNAGTLPPTRLMPPNPEMLRQDPVSRELVDVTRLNVHFRSDVTMAAVQAIAARLGARLVGYNPAFNAHVFEFPNNQTIRGLEALRQQLASESGVDVVLRETTVRPRSFAIDTRDHGGVWVDERNKVAHRSVAYARARIFEAIDAIRESIPDASQFKQARIAIIDSGFDPALPGEFQAGGVTLFSPDAGGNFVVTDAKDVKKHGTEVTSIIAAINDGSQFSGVTNSLFAPDETPMSVVVYDATDVLGQIHRTYVLNAITELARSGPYDVLNMSFGADYSSDPDTYAAVSRIYRRYLALLRGTTLVVTATGNDGIYADLDLPSSLSLDLPYVMSIGATAVENFDYTGEPADARAIFGYHEERIAGLPCGELNRQGSDCGSTVTLAAPGEDVSLVVARGRQHAAGGTGYEEHPRQSRGTSFATPMASGVAAIMQLIRTTPQPMPADELRRLLVRTADDVSSTWRPGPMRRLNALSAVRAVLGSTDKQFIYVSDQDADNGDGRARGKIVALGIDPLTGMRRQAVLDLEIPLTFPRPSREPFSAGAPTTIAVSPTGSEAYVVVESFDPVLTGANPNLGDGVLVIDTTALKAVAFIPFCGAGPTADQCDPLSPAVKQPASKTGLVFSRDGRLAYVATGKRITVINTVTRRVVRRLFDLPTPYNSLSASPSQDPLRERFARIERTVAVGFEDPAAPGQMRAGAFISALALSPDGKVLYAAMHTGGGRGNQTGAVLRINVDLYSDRYPSSAGLQSDLTSYFTPILPLLIMRDDSVGTAGDEPADIGVSPDGKHLYLINGGLNYFQSYTPEQLRVGHYLNLLGAQALGATAMGTIGGVGGLLAGLNAFATTSSHLYTSMVSEFEQQMRSGVSFMAAPGYTGVFNVDPGSPRYEQQEWLFPSDVVFGWAPSPNAGGLIVNQFRMQQVFAKRPFGIAIRPDGKRAILPLFQTGNFAILDLEAQQKFQTAPPAGPPPHAMFSRPELAGLFQGVVAVTPAIPLDNHLWPRRGVMPPQNVIPTPPRLLNLDNEQLVTVPSPDEALLFPQQAEYAQNGRFAVASHTGSGKQPFSMRVKLPDFAQDFMGARVPLLELGFKYLEGNSATAPDGRVVSVGGPAVFRRGGGAVSIIHDTDITNDFTSHLTTNELSAGPGGIPRAYYSVIPACQTVLRDRNGMAAPVCETEVVDQVFDYHTAEHPEGRFYRPRGITVQPFVTFETPRFGDHVTSSDAVRIRWRDTRIGRFHFRVYDLDDVDAATEEPRLTGIVDDAITPEEMRASSVARSFESLFTLKIPPVHFHRYRIETRIIATSPEAQELSRTHVDVRFDHAREEPISDRLHLRPIIIAQPILPATKQLRVLFEPGDGSAPDGIDVTADPETTYEWIGNGLITGLPAGLDFLEIKNKIKDELIKASGLNVNFDFASISVSSTGLLTIDTPGIQVIRARYKGIPSGLSVVLAGLKLDKIDLVPYSVITTLSGMLVEAVGRKVNPPLVLVSRDNGLIFEHGAVILHDATFKYLGGGTIGITELMGYVRPIIDTALTAALVEVTGPFAPAVAHAITKLMGLGLRAIGTQFLNLESADPSVATVINEVPFKGAASSVSPGVTGITGTLDLDDFGKASDTVMTWVLPDLEKATLEPPVTVISVLDPPTPGPFVRTFADVKAVTSAPIAVPESFQSTTEFLDQFLPGGLATWVNGSIDRTFGTDVKFRIRGTAALMPKSVVLRDVQFGFHVPNHLSPLIRNDYTIADTTIAQTGTTNWFNTHLVHQGMTGESGITANVAIVGMGSAKDDGRVIVWNERQPVLHKRIAGQSTTVEPGAAVSFEILVLNPTDTDVTGVLVTDELVFNGTTIQTRTFELGTIRAHEGVIIPVTVTTPGSPGVLANRVRATGDTIRCDRCEVVMQVGPLVTVNEVVVQPQRDWDDSGPGGDGVPFNATPGASVAPSPAVTTSDQWLEIRNAGSPVDLNGWTVNLTTAGATTQIALPSRMFAAGDVLVVPSPSGLATTTSITVRDNTGVVRDTVDLGAAHSALGNATSIGNEALRRSLGGGPAAFVRGAATIGQP